MMFWCGPLHYASFIQSLHVVSALIEIYPQALHEPNKDG
jgi:hypothetical protein